MPQDPTTALCEAVRDFLDTHKDLITQMQGTYSNQIAAMVEDLHQLRALVGAWERSKERTPTYEPSIFGSLRAAFAAARHDDYVVSYNSTHEPVRVFFAVTKNPDTLQTAHGYGIHRYPNNVAAPPDTSTDTSNQPKNQ